MGRDCSTPYRVPVWVLAAAVPIQLPTIVPGKAAAHHLGNWLPTTHMRDPEEAPGCWKISSLSLLFSVSLLYPFLSLHLWLSNK